eukprot:jgi/Mesvir1/25939/Mv20933-RA.1
MSRYLPVRTLAAGTLEASSFLPSSLSSQSKPDHPRQAAARAAFPRVVCDASTSSRSSHMRRKQNVPGDFYVDNSCIDCDACRWMVPTTFTRVDGMSAVTRQPTTEPERLRALQALLACPTGSIRTETPPPDIKSAHASIPIPLDGDAGASSRLPGVYHCAYHSQRSYGAASYFIVREGGAGNILIDSPRFNEQLANRLNALGGVRYMFLTHRDDVADHAAFAKHFGCTRIIHKLEVTAGTRDVEVQLEGEGPWRLPGSNTLEDDVEIIFTPGHTQGHICLLYRGGQGALFTGDHLAYSARIAGLTVFKDYCWYSVEKQMESVAKLARLPFLWVIPGHGRMTSFRDEGDKVVAIERLLRAGPGTYDD